jgi:AcrR family transcriptional regulator
MEGPHPLSSRQRIIAAGRSEVEERGILGLRVQVVAVKADVSVPLIYKYYGDRDGLLAVVLSEMFEEMIFEQIETAESFLNNVTSPTVDDLVAVLALPQQDFRRARRWLQVQIFAASAEIPALRTQLAIAQSAVHERITRLMETTQRRITGGRDIVSPRALALLAHAYAFGLVLNDLSDGDADPITDDEFSAMMRSMIVGAFQGDPTRSVH